MNDVYINAVGAYLPGEAVPNERMADYLGPLDDRQAMISRKALKQNGIQNRHYALDTDGKPTDSNAGMAAKATRAALDRSELSDGDVEMLAAGASAGDVIAPGFASMVHGATGLPAVEIASFNSFCAAGMMALKSVHDGIAGGQKTNGVACASEFASRFLRSGYLAGAETTTDTEFLRWMLSDGAGAVVMENRPNARGLSLKVEFVDLVSYADRMATCMYGGARKNGHDVPGSDVGLPWSNYPTLGDAIGHGALHLQQDLKLLEQIVPLGMARYLELIEDGRVDPEEIDWGLYHFSSDVFRRKMIEHADRIGASINANKIFTNLYEKGNTGSASIFIMLEELFNSGKLKPGQKILCMVPESGRFVFAYMLLTVVEGGAAKPANGSAGDAEASAFLTSLNEVGAAGDDTRQRLARELTKVWLRFESDLAGVPILDKLNRGKLRLDDYKLILLNMRQQVMEGARWIARAASNVTIDGFALRSTFIGHAHEEHRDYQMLEDNYISVGGTLEEIETYDKNIGSEALSAWMFHKAGRENPIDLLGAMFVIEGLGNRMARRWGEAIRDQLGLEDSQVSFMLYHGENDEAHLAKLWDALAGDWLTDDVADAIIKTAKVTARLYRLQLEELGNT